MFPSAKLPAGKSSKSSRDAAFRVVTHAGAGFGDRAELSLSQSPLPPTSNPFDKHLQETLILWLPKLDFDGIVTLVCGMSSFLQEKLHNRHDQI